MEAEYNSPMHNTDIRPKIYKLAATAVLMLTFGLSPVAPQSSVGVARILNFYHTHTDTRLSLTFAHGQNYDMEALAQANVFFGDFRDGEQIEIDPALFDFLHDLQMELNSEGTFEVISAYRSQATNDMLRARSSGVARSSQHLLGKAIDVRLTDVPLAELRDTAIKMQRGGVGFYKASNFVHLDTGRVRRW